MVPLHLTTVMDPRQALRIQSQDSIGLGRALSFVQILNFELQASCYSTNHVSGDVSHFVSWAQLCLKPERLGSLGHTTIPPWLQQISADLSQLATE